MTVVASAVEAASEHVSSSPTVFARRLNRLFDKLQDEGNRRGNEDVAAAITTAGTKISSSYLWLLRTGRRDNPGHHHIQALAAYFQVPPAYFFDNSLSDAMERELDLIAAMRQPAVRRLAKRAVGLSPGVLDALLVMVGQARQAQGLPALSLSEDPDEQATANDL